MTNKQELIKNEIRSFTTFQIFCEKKLNDFCKAKGFGKSKNEVWQAVAFQVWYLWGHGEEKLRMINDFDEEDNYHIWLFCLGGGIEDLMETHFNLTNSKGKQSTSINEIQCKMKILYV